MDIVLLSRQDRLNLVKGAAGPVFTPPFDPFYDTNLHLAVRPAVHLDRSGLGLQRQCSFRTDLVPLLDGFHELVLIAREVRFLCEARRGRSDVRDCERTEDRHAMNGFLHRYCLYPIGAGLPGVPN